MSIDLQKILEMAAPFASEDTKRFDVNGVRIECQDDKLRAVATDGKTLITIDTMMGNIHDLPTGDYTIPLSEVKKIIKTLKSDVNYKFTTEQKKELTQPSSNYWSFPDYVRVLTSHQNLVNDSVLNNISSLDAIYVDKIGKVAAIIHKNLGGKDCPIKITNGGKDHPMLINIDNEQLSVTILAMPLKIN